MPKAKAKPVTKKKKSNVGLKASKFKPLGLDLRPSALKKVNRNALVAIIIVVVIAGGYLLYRGTHADTVTSSNTLKQAVSFPLNSRLTSANGAYYAILQSNGSLAVRQSSNGAVLWGCGCGGLGGVRMIIGGTGNLAILNSGGAIVWQTFTANLGGSYLQIRNDGYLVLYSGYGTPVWSNVGGILVKSGCINPLAGVSWGPERTDRGVDYSITGSQPIRAICSGVIQSTYVPGWPGNSAYIQYKLTSYPPGHPELLGKCIYMAEYITTASPDGHPLTTGDSVRAGDVLGYGHGDQEWGWSQSPGNPSSPKRVNSSGVEIDTLAGNAMARFLRSLGAGTRDTPNPVSGPFVDGTPCS